MYWGWRLRKFNPYHDAEGRFTTAPEGVDAGSRNGKPSGKAPAAIAELVRANVPNSLEIEGKEYTGNQQVAETVLSASSWLPPPKAIKALFANGRENAAASSFDTGWSGLFSVYAGVNGISSEEAARMAVEKVKGLDIPSASVWTRISGEALDNIVLRGEPFKNQHYREIEESGGFYGPDMRAETEQEMFGISPDAGPHEHPFYGYLSKDPNGLSPSLGGVDTVWQYGSYAVRFKDHVKEHTTFSNDDSLGFFIKDEKAGNRYQFLPSPMLHPSPVSFMPSAFFHSKAKEFKDFSNTYYEAQLHGQPTRDDIAEIVVYNYRLYLGLKARMAGINIPVRLAINPHD